MTERVTNLTQPRVTFCGDSALLLEAEGALSLETQQGIWNLSEEARGWPDVIDVQPGMNNLLVTLDPVRAEVEAYAERLLAAWLRIPRSRGLGRLIEIAVAYGGPGGQDLGDVASHHALSPQEIAALHAAPEYVVFAPGTGTGFGYLFGLDPRLFTPRRKVPVQRPVGGTVLLGGAQSNLGTKQRPGGPAMTTTGWYAIGQASDLPTPFDLACDPPNLLTLGDRIRFRVDRVEA